jgi:glycosyltransferase involved in cell wall biosynthesis
MKLTYVVPRYLPHLGGIENHVHAIATRMCERGHEVTVATQREDDHDLPAVERLDSGAVVRRFASGARLRGQGLSPALWRWLREGAGGADLVHAHNYHALTTAGVLRSAPRPLVFTPHYLGAGEGLAEAGLHAVHRPVMRGLLRRVARVICVTPSEAELFRSDLWFGGDCAVIPNGVDVERVRTAVPEPVDGRLLVVAGRLEEYKQPQSVLAALPLLPPEYRLALLGAGPMEGRLRALADELGVADRVLTPGKLPPDGVYSWFRAADAVVTLSRRECYGMTVAEGLAAGAAVVASDIGAHRDVIGQTGASAARLVPTDAGPGRVAAAILDVAGADGAAARGQVPTWPEVADATEALYRSLHVR